MKIFEKRVEAPENSSSRFDILYQYVLPVIFKIHRPFHDPGSLFHVGEDHGSVRHSKNSGRPQIGCKTASDLTGKCRVSLITRLNLAFPQFSAFLHGKWLYIIKAEEERRGRIFRERETRELGEF